MHRVSFGPCLLAVSFGLALPALAGAAEPTMPLSDVRAGMQCTALSVVQGTVPTTFNATVLGVNGGPRPSDALIVMRFSGAAIDGTGIGQGFSGSPVSCPDGAGTMRVVGAISQGIGQYDNLVAGVTPIEAMLATPTTGAGMRTPVIGALSSPKAKAGALRAEAASGASAPWGTGRTQLFLSGVRGPLAVRLAKWSTDRGRPMVVGAPATRSAAGGSGGLAGGDAVAVSAVTGDISAGAIGTVTYVDGDRVWAFGHPFNGSGPSRLVMQQASIITVIGSPSIGEQVSYKLGMPGASVGTIGFDGSFAIGGQLGAQPGMISTDVSVRNAAGAEIQSARAQVVDERPVRGANTTGLLTLAAAANAGAAIQRLSNQATVGGAARTCTTITLKGQPVPLHQCADSSVASPDASVGGIEMGVAEAVGMAVGPVMSAERFTTLIDRVHVDVKLRDEADTAQLVRIRQPGRVRAGRLVTVRVVLIQGSTGERREVPITVRIPRAAAGVKTGIAVFADPVESATDGGYSEDGDAMEPPKNLPALRSLYTAAGISGIRVLAVPGMTGSELMSTLGGEDSGLSDEELAALQQQATIAKEFPTVALTGGAAVTVRPVR